MLLFIAVAAALYVLYTKPETVPGRQVRPPGRPVSYTAVPGSTSVGSGQAAPTEGGAAAGTNAAVGTSAPAGTSPPAGTSAADGTSAGQAAEASASDAARTEGAE
jgi:hypothetical protein